MRKAILYLIIIFPLFSYAQNLKVSGKVLIDDTGNEVLLRGMGLGGWMLQEGYMLQLSSVADAQHEIEAKIESEIGPENKELFYEAWLNNHTRKIDIDSLKAWGFNSIRLPMHYKLYTLSIQDEPVAGENTWLDKGFAMTDSLLKWCTQNEMYLILDLHGAPGGQGRNAAISDYNPIYPSLWESDMNKQKTIALWRKLADRYKDEPWIGGYDLINETNWGFEDKSGNENGCNESGNVDLRNLLIDITSAIREVDNKHIIYVEGNCWANNFSGIFPAWDDNMVASFHKYWSFNDSESIQWMLEIRDEYNIPLWLGESGENSNTWFKDAITLAEKNQIGWALWPLKKIGLNNLLEIKKNSGYENLVKYWEGDNSVPVPTQQEAFDALMQLAENTRLENSVYHKDIADAMIRQPHDDTSMPFTHHKVIDGYILFAVDYDLGKENVAYSDKVVANYHQTTGNYTAWNTGWSYRNDGVDIEACTDTYSNGYAVGWFEENEWLKYTVDVQDEGLYTIGVRLTTDYSGNGFQVEVNGFLLEKVYSFPRTGGWSNWITINAPNVYLNKGVNTIKIINRGSDFNFNYISFKGPGQDLSTGPDLNAAKVEAVNPSQIALHFNQPLKSIVSPVNVLVKINDSTFVYDNPVLHPDYSNVLLINLNKPVQFGDLVKLSYSGAALMGVNEVPAIIFTNFSVEINLDRYSLLYPVPGKIEAEDTKEKYGMREDDCFDIGGGKYMGWADKGSYMVFDGEVTMSGTYQVVLRYATQVGSSKFNLYVMDGETETVLCSGTLPSTGNWQKWMDFNSESFNLTKGEYMFKIEVMEGEFNTNYMDFDIVEVPVENDFEFVSGETDIYGEIIQVDFNKDIDVSTADKSQFSVIVNGSLRPIVNLLSNDLRSIELSVSPSIKAGDIVKLSYRNNATFKAADASPLKLFAYKWIDNKAIDLSASVLPGKIEVEDFTFNSGFSFETCTDVGGGENAGYTDNGDFLDFDVYVMASSTYDLAVRVAALSASGNLRFEDVTDGNSDFLTQLTFPATGGWQTWSTVEGKIELQEGFRKIRMKAQSSQFNINWFEVSGGITSVENYEMLSQCNIYPNPTKNHFTLTYSMPIEKIRVFNSQGKEFAVSYNQSSSFDVQVNHNLPSGLYLIEIISGKQKLLKRIVVE